MALLLPLSLPNSLGYCYKIVMRGMTTSRFVVSFHYFRLDLPFATVDFPSRVYFGGQDELRTIVEDAADVVRDAERSNS